METMLTIESVKKILAFTAVVLMAQIVYFGFIQVSLKLLLFSVGSLLFVFTTYRYPEIYLIKSAKELDPYLERVGRNLNFWLSLLLMLSPIMLSIFGG